MTLELFGATGSAAMSPCGRYRYRLDRVFRLDGPRVCWVMLNPSTADATATDPTLTRCIGYARRWGFGALTIVNLFAWRATKPKDLPTDVAVAVGPEADVHIADALRGASKVICGWGRVPAPLRGGPRVAQVSAMIRDAGLEPMALALTNAGQPRHPLYLRADAVPFVWRPQE